MSCKLSALYADVIMLNAIMLSVIMLSVIMQSVIAPNNLLVWDILALQVEVEITGTKGLLYLSWSQYYKTFYGRNL